MSLNANTPNVVGCEWMPTRQRGLPLDVNRSPGVLFTPGAVTGDDIAVYLKNVVGSPNVSALITKTSDIAVPAPSTSTYYPTADVIFTNAAHANLGTTPPFYVDIDESVLNTADYVTNTTTGTFPWGYNVGSGAFAGRVLSVQHWFVVNTVAGASTSIYPWVRTGSTYDYHPSGVITAYNAQPQTYGAIYYVNPHTGTAWTAADVTALASASSIGFDVGSGNTNGFRLYQSYVIVSYVTETRLAIGSAVATADGWLSIPMSTPAGASTWTPATATQYALILSTPTAGGYAAWGGLDSGSAHPDYSSAPITWAAGYPVTVGTTDTAVPGFVVINSTPQYGQPYISITEQEVYSGHVVQQQVTLPGTQSRGWLRFVARQSSGTTTASLVAKLKRSSDGVQIGGDVTVAPFDVRAEPRLPQQISMPAASGAAATAAQHYVEWSCTGATGLGWLLTTLETGNATYAALSAGGTTDALTVSGSRSTTADAPVLVGLTRTSPTGLTVVQT